MGSPSFLPGSLPNPGIEPRSPALQADSLPAEPQRKLNKYTKIIFFLKQTFHHSVLPKVEEVMWGGGALVPGEEREICVLPFANNSRAERRLED